MVLRASPTQREDGFSLIELLTAITVASIALALAFGFHRDFGKSIRKAWTLHNQGMAEAAWVATLQRGLMEGEGLVEVWPGGLAYQNRVGTILRLEKTPADSMVHWNGKPLVWNFSKFEIGVTGPDCVEAGTGEEPDCRSLLDSLDWNGDRRITLEELDRNRDGRVSGRETRHVRLVEITWKVGALAPERRLIVHPRTRKVDGISGPDLL